MSEEVKKKKKKKKYRNYLLPEWQVALEPIDLDDIDYIIGK